VAHGTATRKKSKTTQAPQPDSALRLRLIQLMFVLVIAKAWAGKVGFSAGSAGFDLPKDYQFWCL
jgi:hypothetical protein